MQDIFALLKDDHDRHRSLLQKLADAAPRDRAGLFEDFRIEVSAHADAEEQSLYAVMLARPALQDDARHSVSEHKEIADFIEELAGLDPAGEQWFDTFGKMRHRYEHHIGEEEEDMFPEAREGLSDAKLAEMADKFRARKPAELANAAAEDPAAAEHKD